MPEIIAAAVMALREKTNLPMMDCKRALVEAEGDEAKAIDILRKAFKKVQVKRQDNATENGRIFVSIRDDSSEAAMVEVQCESDPVGRGEDLANFGEKLVSQLLNGSAASSPEELLQQLAPGDDGVTLQSLYEHLVSTIREKIVVNRVTRVSGPVGGYVHHDYRTGVLFQAEGDGEDTSILRDVAMHIAALKPNVTRPEDLDASIVEAERTRLTEEARATGKPENILEKIVDGRMKTFYEEQGVLQVQKFARDDSKSVSQALAEKGYRASGFTRWVIGN